MKAKNTRVGYSKTAIIQIAHVNIKKCLVTLAGVYGNKKQDEHLIVSNSDTTLMQRAWFSHNNKVYP